MSCIPTHCTESERVSLGFRDLTRISCGIRKSEKFLGGIRDLTATWEVGFDKILPRVANLERKWQSVQRWQKLGMWDDLKKEGGMESGPHRLPYLSSRP